MDPAEVVGHFGLNLGVEPLTEVQTLLYARLEQRNEGLSRDDAAILHYELEQLPHALEAAAFHLTSLCTLQRLAANDAVARRGLGPRKTMQLDDVWAKPMAFHVDGFFDAARRAQNACIHYVSRTFDLHSLPKSTTKLRKHMDRLPQGIRAHFEKYMAGPGGRLKDYRDFAEHTALVSSDARVAGHPDGRVLIHLVLPANPSGPLRSLRFRDPFVDAYPFCRAAFAELYEFVWRLGQQLLERLGRTDTFVASLMLKGGLRIGEWRGHTPPSEQDIPTLLRQLRERLIAGG